MRRNNYLLTIACGILLSLFCNQGYSQITLTADSTGCGATSTTLHAHLLGDVPTASGITADDGYSSAIDIGFSFDFYGTTYTQVLIGSNGCLCFDLSLAGGYNPWPITAALAGNSSAYNSICGPWCDIYIPAGGTITYSTDGTAPYRKFSVTFCTTAMFSCTSQWTTTQMIIYETTNIVEVHIGHKTICSGWNGGYAIVGVQNASGSASTAAPSRDYPTDWSTTDEAWRFTPNASVSAYTCSSITYAPIPYSSSTISWFDSATHTYIGSGDSITVTPTGGSGTYYATAAGCADSTFAYIHVNLGASSTTVGNHIASLTYTNPTVCGACDGTLHLNGGLTPGVTDTVYYNYNGSVYSYYTSTLGDSSIIVTGLCPGTYSSIYVHNGNPCPTNVVGPVTLVNPPNIQHIEGLITTNPSVCGACDGSIRIVGGLTPGKVDTFYYSKNGVPQPPFYATVGGDSSVTLSGLCEGTYSDIWEEDGPICPTNIVGPVTLTNPPIHADFTLTPVFGCTSDKVILNNISSPGGFNSTWRYGDGSSDTIYNPTHVYTSQGTYVITLVYSTYGVCFDSMSQTVSLIHPLSSVFTPSANAVCLGTPITFNNTSVGGGATYHWDFGDGTIDNSKNPSHTYGTGGVYNVKLTVTDSIPCSAVSDTSIEVVSITVQTGFHDTTVCLRTPMPLTSTVVVVPDTVSGMAYQWTPGTNLTNPYVKQPDFFGVGNFTYSFTAITTTLGCNATDVETIHSKPPLVMTDITTTQYVKLGGSVQLNATGAWIYAWTPNDGSLNNPNISDPVATPTDSVETYTVVGMTEYGCRDTATVTVYVDQNTQTIVPSGFTPNGDGKNDIFRLYNMTYQKLIDFKVFNRWGKMVFQTADASKGWDGNYNGEPQDVGTYFYEITVGTPEGTQQTISGSVTLIR